MDNGYITLKKKKKCHGKGYVVRQHTRRVTVAPNIKFFNCMPIQCMMYYCSYTPTSFHMQWMHVTVNNKLPSRLTNQEPLYENVSWKPHSVHVLTSSFLSATLVEDLELFFLEIF